MTYRQAKEMLLTADRSQTPSKINKSMTRGEAVGIVEAAVDQYLDNNGDPTAHVENWMVKRVLQVVSNRRRPIGPV